MISVPLLQSPISSSRQGRPGDDARICLPQNHDSGQGKVFEAHENKEFEAFSYTQGPLEEPQQLTCIRPAPAVPTSTTQSRANQMLNPGHVQLEFQSELPPSPIRFNPKKEKTDSDESKSQVVAVNTSQTSQNDGCEKGLDNNDSNVGHDNVPVDGIVGSGFVQPFDAFEKRILLDLDQQDCGGLCDAAKRATAVDRFQDEPLISAKPKVMPTASVASFEASWGPSAANMVEIKSAVSLFKKGNLQDCHVDPIEFQQNPDGILCQDSSLKNLTLPRIAGLNNVENPPPRPAGAGLARGDQTDLDETVQPPAQGGNPTTPRAAGNRVSASVSAGGPNPAGLAVADHDNHEKRDAASSFFATATATTSSFVSVITSSSASLHNVDYSKPYDDSCNKTMKKNQYLTYLESTTLNIKPSDDTIANPENDKIDDDTDKADDRLTALSSAGVEVRPIRDQSQKNQQSKPNNKTTGTAITRAQKKNIKHFPHSPSKIDVINVQDTIIDATTGSSGSNQEENETNATSAASDVVPLFSNNNQCSSVVKVGLGNNLFPFFSTSKNR